MVANCELAALKPEARCRAKAMARNDIIQEIGAGKEQSAITETAGLSPCRLVYFPFIRSRRRRGDDCAIPRRERTVDVVVTTAAAQVVVSDVVGSLQ
jgi:hypothetical protein